MPAKLKVILSIGEKTFLIKKTILWTENID